MLYAILTATVTRLDSSFLTDCPSHNTRGQRPNAASLYFSLTASIPAGVVIYLACISPYNSLASASTAAAI
jgi:hypothetical protein